MKYVPLVLSAVLLILLLFVFKTKNEEINSINQQNYALSQQLAGLTEKYNKMVGDANKKLSVASLPEVTANVGFRKAMLGSGLVAQITNTSGASAPFTFEAKRPSTGQSRAFDMVLDSGGMREIGHAEGWAFVNGDTITVSQPDHKARIYSVNQ